MSNASTQQQKFLHLENWFQEIVESIKKDLKQEHLRQDNLFLKRYFPGKNVNRLTVEELSQGYFQALQNADTREHLEEFIANRWLLKHSDLYYFFETKLSEIDPNFANLEKIEDPAAEKLLQEAISSFGAVNTYLFSILNSVVFSEAIFAKLKTLAEKEKILAKTEEKTGEEARSLEQLRISYEEKISRLSDRYEKKILGLQRKYTQDVEGLKKQIVNLQRKLKP